MWARLRFIITHRSYVLSVARGYLSVIAAYLLRPRRPVPKGETVYLDVSARTNRSLFNLVWVLSKNGFRILVPHRPAQLSQMGFYDKWMLRLSRVYLTLQVPEKIKPDIVVTDDLARNGYDSPQTRVVKLSFAYYKRPRSSAQLHLPFGCHPRARMLGLEDFSREIVDSPRKYKVFFAGNFSAADYQKEEISTTFGILNRSRFMKVVSEFISEHGSAVDPMIRIVDQGPEGQGLKMKDYFSSLGKSSFVLCPPGVNHPQCHNLEEAMLMGGIPVLEYGHYLAVPLIDGENCVGFSGKEGLKTALARIFSMSEECISAMRGRVRDYARENLSPLAQAARLADKGITQILVLNELQSARLHAGSGCRQ